MTPSTKEATHLLVAWRNGDWEALNRLLPLIYDELRHLAHRYFCRPAYRQGSLNKKAKADLAEGQP